MVTCCLLCSTLVTCNLIFYNSYPLSNILLYIPVVSILNWYIYPLAIRDLKQDVNVITTVWLLAMKVAYLYRS